VPTTNFLNSLSADHENKNVVRSIPNTVGMAREFQLQTMVKWLIHNLLLTENISKNDTSQGTSGHNPEPVNLSSNGLKVRQSFWLDLAHMVSSPMQCVRRCARPQM